MLEGEHKFAGALLKGRLCWNIAHDPGHPPSMRLEQTRAHPLMCNEVGCILALDQLSASWATALLDHVLALAYRPVDVV